MKEKNPLWIAWKRVKQKITGKVVKCHIVKSFKYQTKYTV